MTARAVATVALAAALAVEPAGAVARDASIDLRIAIAASARSGAPTRTWTLRCDPSGGSWRGRVAACARLTPSALAPITVETRDLVAVTRQPLRVTGRAYGRRVDLVFGAEGSSTRRARYRLVRRALGEGVYRTAQQTARR
jgi:hypothetical protein